MASGKRLSAAEELAPPAKYVPLVNASTHQRVGRPFRLSVALLRPGLKERYRGRISFQCSDPGAALPAPYEFSARDDLYESHLFEVTLSQEGQHTISIRDAGTGIEASSNVVMASKREPKHKLYFGDIHIHSRWSVDGRGEPDYNYIYARDAMNLDFACLTEHDPTDDIWGQIKAKARELYQPGKFATLSAYEWTAHKMKEGHKNVYYREWEGPVLRANWRTDRTCQTTSAADLWSQLRRYGKPLMTIPHHPASKAFPAPWEHYDPEFQRCVEVYSSWGNSESPAGPRQIKTMGGSSAGHFAQDALALGHRIGFVGASDSHSGRPGYPAHSRLYHDSDYSEWEPEEYTGGFTGVYAEELTREAIFDAIRARRCYATTGKRIVVEFKADGHWMGEEYGSHHAPHFQVRVMGTAPIEVVTLVRNNRDYYSRRGDGREMEFEFGKTERPQDTDYYYVRVIQRDGEMAWSSPIWISRQ